MHIKYIFIFIIKYKNDLDSFLGNNSFLGYFKNTTILFYIFI